jgi:hypothetical protein
VFARRIAARVPTHWSEVSGGRTAIGTAEYGMDDWRAAPSLQHVSRSEA